MRIYGLLGAAISLTFVAYTAAGDAASSDRQKLQGTWKVLAANEGGKTLLPSRVRGTKMVVKANEIKVEEQDKQRVMTFVLDPAKEPCAIDLTMREGKPKAETSQGIYALDGDLLKICFAPPGKTRPVNFTPAPGSGEMLFVLKRAAPQ